MRYLTIIALLATGAAPALAQPAGLADRLTERARETREIVYFLRDPDTHAFDLYHDYTEQRPGVGQYLNIVRPGSQVANQSAVNLDTGEALEVRTAADTVAIAFAPVRPGRTTRIRIRETYTDSARYRRVGDELIWDRAFGRAANAVVLPAGWRLTHSNVPGTVALTTDGRIRIDFINPRLDEIEVLIVARRLSVR
jgi:hypothetical protein